MRVEVNHRCSDYNSYRAARVKSLFNAESGCNWDHVAELPIEGNDWNIGLIVGASGTGKTSIGQKLFGSGVYDLYSGWDANKPIIDCIDPDGDFNSVTGALSSVGLGDVPAWLRPFHVLSNGEKFRAGLARLICNSRIMWLLMNLRALLTARLQKSGRGRSQRHGKELVKRLSCYHATTI